MSGALPCTTATVRVPAVAAVPIVGHTSSPATTGSTTPNAGQTVCSAFDVSDPLKPVFIAQIPLGNLTLPSGALRNKKSINLVYVRVGAKGQTA